jgi:hypothetical protein
MRALFFFVFFVLWPLYLPLFFLFIFLPKKVVTKVLYLGKALFYPLRIFLLTPGVIHSFFIQKIHWFRDHQHGDEVVLILGGNAMSPNQAYDGIYAQLIKDKREELDCACIPLQLHYDEKSYIRSLVEQCRTHILPGRSKIFIYGHSLGGALALSLTQQLQKNDSNLQIHLFLSRTFNNLWNVTRYLYGPFVGNFFEKIFSELWVLDSQKILDQINKENITIRLEQTVPDEVLGSALLEPKDQKIDYKLFKLDEKVNLYPEMVHAVSQAHLESLRKKGWLKEEKRIRVFEPIIDKEH